MGDLWRREWKGAIMDGSNMGGQASRPFSRLLGWPTDATDSLLLTVFPTLKLSASVIFSLFQIESRGTVHNQKYKGKREDVDNKKDNKKNCVPNHTLPLVHRNSNTP